MCGSAVIGAEQNGSLIGQRSDDGDLFDGLQGSTPSFFSSTMDSFAMRWATAR